MRPFSSRPFAQRLLVGSLLVPPLGGAGYLFWSLHDLHPRVKTPVAIDRNSLLPHAYSGPCMNCHRIVEVGPVEMNRDNMQSFDLSPRDRRLVIAGQRVVVPTLAQKLRVPAITRTDPLPHPYVGVCSNCHVILDVKPSPEAVRAALRLAYQPLVGLSLDPEQIARGGTTRDFERAGWRRIWGYVAAGAFTLGAVYLLQRLLVRIAPTTFDGMFEVKRWLLVHECAFSVFCLAVCVHWYYSDKGNNLLHIALLLVLWLGAAGALLHIRLANGHTNKGGQLLHTQRFLFLALCLLILVGHLFADYR